MANIHAVYNITDLKLSCVYIKLSAGVHYIICNLYNIYYNVIYNVILCYDIYYIILYIMLYMYIYIPLYIFKWQILEDTKQCEQNL